MPKSNAVTEFNSQLPALVGDVGIGFNRTKRLKLAKEQFAATLGRAPNRGEWASFCQLFDSQVAEATGKLLAGHRIKSVSTRVAFNATDGIHARTTATGTKQIPVNQQTMADLFEQLQSKLNTYNDKKTTRNKTGFQRLANALAISLFELEDDELKVNCHKKLSALRDCARAVIPID